MIRYLLLLSLLWVTPLRGQERAKTLSLSEMMELVKQFHPVAKQADINIAIAKADLLQARGMFDPVLDMNYNVKTFDGTRYYNHFQPAIVIPSWYGIELHTGLENWSGSRINPEETQGKTSYAGIMLPLAKNLLMDKRRAVLQQAKLMMQMSEVEKRAILNDLLRDAINTYWSWAGLHQQWELVKKAVATNEKRLALVRLAYFQGDRAAIDTIEVMAQLQTYKIAENEIQLKIQNASLDLSAFLWNNTGDPVNLPSGVQPPNAMIKDSRQQSVLPVLDELLLTVNDTHPELVQLRYKVNVLEVEKKLKWQELLPLVNLKYNQLGKGYNVLKNVSAPLLNNNFRYGIMVEVPLRLSAGRGAYRKAKWEIRQMELQRDQKNVSIQNKIKSYYNTQLALLNQIRLQEQQSFQLRSLLTAEETKYFNGESSLFLINNREMRALEAAQKLVEMEVKYIITGYDLQWAAGRLSQQ